MRKRALTNKSLITIILLSSLVLSLIIFSSCVEEKDLSQSTVPVHEHSFGEWAVTKEPTCTDDGYKECVCVCGEKKNEAIPPLGHMPGEAFIENEVRATCTEDGGFDTVIYCAACNTELSRKTEIIKAEHVQSIPVTENETSATCTEDGGYDLVTHCVVCNEELSRTTVVEKAKGHTVVFDKAVAATCVRPGNTEGSHCSACGAVITAQTVVKAKGHVPGETVITSLKPATCTENGLNESATYCVACNAIFSKEIKEVTASGHEFVDRVCKKCDETIASQGLTYELDRFYGTNRGYVVTGMGTCTDSVVYIAKTYNGKPVTRIDQRAFANQTGLKEIYVPSSVLRIGQHAFIGCSSLEKITIPFIGETAGLTVNSSYQYPLGYLFGASYNPDFVPVRQKYYLDGAALCSTKTYYIPPSLRSVTVTGGNILYGAFYNCKMLTCVTLGDGVQSINDAAFFGCDDLVSVSVGKGITSIGKGIFAGCGSIEEIRVAEENTVYRSAENCIIEIESKKLIAGCSVSVIPDDGSVASIGDRAFYGCSNLTNITIPASVTSIGDEAFLNCSRLYKITNDSNLAISLFEADNGYVGFYAKIIVDKDGKRIVADKSNDLYDYFETEDGFLFSCKDGIYRLMTYFGNKDTVTLPDSINGSAYQIISFCTSGIRNLVIPECATEIDGYAFNGFAGLVSITIPSNVMRIGEYAFVGCTNLKTVVYTGSVERWALIAIYKNNDELLNADIVCTGSTQRDPLDRYNGRYGYNYLGNLENGGRLQLLYNRIDAYAKSFHKDSRLSASRYNGDQYFCAFKVDMDDLYLTQSEARDVFVTYTNDNPLFYWMRGTLLAGSSYMYVVCAEEYADGNVRIQYNEYLYGRIEYYLAQSKGKYGNYSIARLFHDLIIAAIDYSFDENGEPESAVWAHSIIGVLSGKGSVCEGYAKTYQLLLNLKGVENIYVTGPASSVRHAWNLVRLDDGNWYWVDVTWDDVGGDKGAVYKWFCVNDGSFPNHSLDTPGSDDYLYDLPARAGASKYVGTV